jgi:hypothetical protein
MLIRRFFVPVVMLLLSSWLLADTAVAGHTGATTAHALQHPVNQSGVMGEISFTETGTGLLVTGTATGLQPSVGRYVSLVYDLGDTTINQGFGPEAVVACGEIAVHGGR